MPETNTQEANKNQNQALDQKLNVIPATVPDQKPNLINTAPTQSPNSFFYYLSKHTVFGSVLILLTGLVLGFLAFEAIAPEDSRISKKLGFAAVSSSASSKTNSSANSTTNSQSSSSSSSISSSSSVSSSSFSSVFSSTSNSTSSSVSSSLPISVTPISNPKIYTNQYFPNFKLVYPEDWKFETSTKSYDVYQNLLIRSIKLKKGTSTLEIGITPLRVPSGCGGGGPVEEYYQNISQITNELKRFQDKKNLNSYEYAKIDPVCLLDKYLESNIKGSDIKFKDNDWKNMWVQSYGSLEANTKFNYKIVLNTDDSSTITEIDQIISQSSFN